MILLGIVLLLIVIAVIVFPDRGASHPVIVVAGYTETDGRSLGLVALDGAIATGHGAEASDFKLCAETSDWFTMASERLRGGAWLEKVDAKEDGRVQFYVHRFERKRALRVALVSRLHGRPGVNGLGGFDLIDASNKVFRELAKEISGKDPNPDVMNDRGIREWVKRANAILVYNNVGDISEKPGRIRRMSEAAATVVRWMDDGGDRRVPVCLVLSQIDHVEAPNVAPLFRGIEEATLPDQLGSSGSDGSSNIERSMKSLWRLREILKSDNHQLGFAEVSSLQALVEVGVISDKQARTLPGVGEEFLRKPEGANVLAPVWWCLRQRATK
jgi:hypothetical protein